MMSIIVTGEHGGISGREEQVKCHIHSNLSLGLNQKPSSYEMATLLAVPLCHPAYDLTKLIVLMLSQIQL